VLHGDIEKTGAIGIGGRMSKTTKGSSGLWTIGPDPSVEIPYHKAAVLSGCSGT